MYYESELYHHGIKGQKWGVRRFQNSDGTLTAAGQKRYSEREAKDRAFAKKRYGISDKDYDKAMAAVNSKDAKKLRRKVIAGSIAASAILAGSGALIASKAMKPSPLNQKIEQEIMDYVLRGIPLGTPKSKYGPNFSFTVR